jgi:hypothetical protein
MFGALEDEIVRILRANLSPLHLPADHIDGGPRAEPQPADLPHVTVTADGFRLSPDEAASPPRASHSLVSETFPPGGVAPLDLSRPPLQPLRSVEVDEPPDGGRVVLHERDDYTVDYVNGRLRLRQPPAGTLHVDYFTSEPLQVTSATRMRVEYHVDVFADDQNVDNIATIAFGSLAANAPAIDGLRSDAQDVVDTGQPGGPRQVIFIFETPSLLTGAQDGPTHWRLDYRVETWMILSPVDAPVGIIREVAATVALDDRFSDIVLGT